MSAAAPAIPASPAAPATDPVDARFDTSHLTKDLKRRTIRGGAVTLTSQGVKFALRLGSTAILARLLTPEDFGLIAMVTVVTGFVEMFKDAGLSMATVQREKITHEQVSTLFWINVGLSVAITAIIAALAPVIAWFYGEPRLLNVTLALAGTMVFGGLAVQHQALLKRNMQFGRLAVIEIMSMAAGISVAVWMAWRGWSYWSLVGMTAGTAIATASISIVLSGWAPGLPMRGSKVGPMLAFGATLAGSDLINYWTRCLDKILVAQVAGVATIGLYTRAFALVLMPVGQLVAPVNAVVLPALCRIQSNRDSFRSAFASAAGVVATLTVPLAVLSAVLADSIVAVVLGPSWKEAAPFVIALSPAILALGIGNTAGWLYLASGNTSLQLRVNIFEALALTVSLSFAAHFGSLAVAWASSLTMLAGRLVSFALILRECEIALALVARPFVIPFLVSGLGVIAAVSACPWIAPASLEHVLNLMVAFVVIAPAILRKLWLRSKLDETAVGVHG